jgi:coenzyme F420-0:L-glutamate ligase/coenzyme F420-1:gamma-L-glutamate ligase
MNLEIIPVRDLPEIEPEDDLAGLIAEHATLREGDVVVIAQKAVSKTEGRVVAIDAERRRQERDAWVARETAAVVARRGDVVIARTRHGFVCANAGVDGSNVAPDRLALLPLDPDGSASRLRRTLRERIGLDLGVIVTDTFGRPWRVGQTNVAIGVSGVAPLRDHRGEKDAFGNLLEATIIAVADEIAGAAELVMGKADAIPVAIVRGLDAPRRDGRASELVRPLEEDMFPTGAIESVEARRSHRAFSERAVPEEVVHRAVTAALTAPVPHGSRVQRPFRFVWLRSRQARTRYLDALASAWRDDMLRDGTQTEVIERRLARSYGLLGRAPVLIGCFVSLYGTDLYADERRARAEREMFVAAAGAAIQNLMVALAAQGVGSCWVSSSLFCPEEARTALGLPPESLAVGSVAGGYPTREPAPRGTPDAGEALDIR